MNFTPGPWKLVVWREHKSKDGAFVGEIVSEHKGYRKIYSGPFSFRSLNGEANARLIAKSPQMFSACKEAAILLARCQKAIEAGDPSLLPSEAERLRVENELRDAIMLDEF